MSTEGNSVLLMRDVVDYELIACDGQRIGRVADIGARCRDDGSLVLENFITGPEALASRVSSRLGALFQVLLRGRFDKRIPLSEVEDVHLEVHLRGRATDYPVGQSDRWIADHILRFIPGAHR